jgi:hypothetical protein
MTPALSPADKARRIVAEGRVQILARSERGALALVTNEQGHIYVTTAILTSGRQIPDSRIIELPEVLGGTCTCAHGVRYSATDSIYSHARGEGCKHYRALLMALEA